MFKRVSRVKTFETVGDLRPCAWPLQGIVRAEVIVQMLQAVDQWTLSSASVSGRS